MHTFHTSRRASDANSVLQTAPAELRSSGSRPRSRAVGSAQKVRVRSKYVPRSQVQKACLLVCNAREVAAQSSAPESKTGSPVQRVLYSRQPVLERTTAGYRYTVPKPVSRATRPRHSFACVEAFKEALVPWGVVHGRSFQARRSLQRVAEHSHQTINVVVPYSLAASVS